MAFSLEPTNFFVHRSKQYWKNVLCVGIFDFLTEKLEPIPLFTNVIGLFICEFSIRGLSLERIYREFRGPPVVV
jgi:hypothetical protein